MSQTRQLAAIMFTDIVGYTKLMGTNEHKAFELLRKNRSVQKPLIERYRGKWLKEIGDGVLASFNSVSDAVHCAKEIQETCRKEEDLCLRIGIHQGEVVFEHNDVFGDGVNIASRLEPLAPPGGILISESVFTNIINKRDLEVVFVREQQLKNVQHPIKIYQIITTGVDLLKSSDPAPGTVRKPRNRMVLFIAAVMLLLALVFFLYPIKDSNPITEQRATEVTKKSIAVLPFDNLSNDPQQEYFNDGMTADLLSQLAKINDLRVISRTSVMRYKDTDKSLKTIADELDVTHILEGSVRKYNDQLRISVNLIEASTDNRIWSVDFDRELKDVLLIQREVSLEVVKLMKANLTEAERSRVEKLITTNQLAYDFYQKGQNLIRRTAGNLKQLDEAVRLFEQAIDHDPYFSQAYAGLANAYMQYADWGRLPPRGAIQKAKAAALKAQSIDDELGESHEILGAICLYQNDLPQARIYLERALEMSPSYVETYTWLGKLSLLEGNLEEAVTYFRTAERLDPLSTIYIGNITLAYHIFGEYDQAIEVAEEVLLEHPTDSYMLWILANTYTEMQQFDLAIDLFKRRTAVAETNWALGYTYGKAGQIEEANKILEYQLERAASTYVPSFMISTIYLGLDDQERAILWMEKAFDEGIMPILMANVLKGSTYANLRANPRFQELISPVTKNIVSP